MTRTIKRETRPEMKTIILTRIRKEGGRQMLKLR